MKKLLLLIIIILSIDLVNAKTISAGVKTTYDFETTKKLIKEVMKDYYIKGDSIQYHNSRRIAFLPEEATSQDIKYTVCSGYVYNSLYGAFNMPFEDTTSEILDSSRAYINKNGNNDGHYLIYFSKYNKYDKAYVYKNNAKFSEIVKLLQPGDVVTFTGHAMIVYDVVKKSDGKMDALLLNSNGTSDVQSRLYSTRSLTYSYDANRKKNNVVDVDVEGGVQYKWLSSFDSRFVDSVISTIDEKGSNVTLDCIRNKLTYYTYDSSNNKTAHAPRCNGENKTIGISGKIEVKCTSDGDAKLFNNGKLINSCFRLQEENYHKPLMCQYDECSILRPYYNSGGKTVFNYTISTDAYDKSILRTKYPGMIIEKTVNKGDNNSVYPDDELTYTIKITNKDSATKNSTTYGKFTIEEKFDSNLVSYVSVDNNGHLSGNTITWTINSLGVNKTQTLKYTVKVKSNSESRTIKAGGKFYQTGTSNIYIETGTVENKIIKKPPKNRDYRACYDKWKNKSTGLELIDKVYRCEWGSQAWIDDFSLTNFSFDKMFGRQKKESDHIYFKDNLNSNYKAIKKMILNDYWGGVTVYSSNEGYTFAPLKWIKGSNAYSRKRTINDIDFKNGDVLIYSINYDGLSNPYTGGTLKTNTSDRFTNEKGIYAFIYIDGQFVGINYPGKANERNEFTYQYYSKLGYTTNLYSGYDKLPSNQKKRILKIANYETLFDKDYYIILRPEIAIASVNTSTGTNLLAGDVNNDNIVNSVDYILIRKHILKNSTLTGDNLKRADVNGDNQVNSIDYIMIRKSILNQ